MLLLLLLVCAVVVLVDNGIDVVADVVGEEEAVDRSDTSADEGDVEVVALEDVLDEIAARPAAII